MKTPMYRWMAVASACAVFSGAVACKKKDASYMAPSGQEGGGAVDNRSESVPPPMATTSEVPGMNSGSPTDVNPVQAQSWIDDVKTGKTLDSEGKVAEHEKVTYRVGDTVFVSMKVGDAPANAAVMAVWKASPGDREINRETKNVTAGQKILSFSQSSKGWGAGTYTVDVFIGDEKVGSETFVIGA